ncbi:hypothetical protein JCGZ_08269 [Jatropha curcas]|uniref:RNase H type-1 domain-containing protein n=1 Tax=Jatropha curcas TaxID=180498 RepID=A0A067KRD9_JATCU|nr:hypothetical protein JCGZ_08269 [Jatropha curcas]
MSVLGAHDPHTADAILFREALSWVKGKGMDRVLFETNSQMLVQALQRPLNDGTYFGSIVADCKLLIEELSHCSFCFMKRSANRVAHLLTTNVYYM